jgi:hypothetical protein
VTTADEVDLALSILDESLAAAGPDRACDVAVASAAVLCASSRCSSSRDPAH